MISSSARIRPCSPPAFAALGLLGISLGGCPATHPPSEGCSKDTDCKGERVCIQAQCVAPSEVETEPVVAVVATPEPKPTAGQDQRWFRGGPGHAGASAFAGPTAEPSLRWSVNLGAVVFATPTLARAGDRLTAYVGTHEGRFVGVVVEGEDAGTITLDVDLGGRIWASAAARGSDDELRLYVGNDDDTLFAIAPGSPDPIAWKLRLGNCEDTRSPGPEGARCDVDGGPTIGPSGDLFVGADGVYRISVSDAEPKILWHWPEPEPEQDDEELRAKHVFSSPIVTANGRVYFGGQDGFVTALDAETGALRWQYTVRADVDGSGVIGPDGELFIGADDGRIYALRSDGSLRWSFVAQRDIRSSAGIAADGTVYATSFDHNLYSIAPSGEVNWVLPTGGIVHSSPVVDVNGTVFFGSQDDRLYAVSPAGKVLWALDIGADVDSSVAISESGTLVIGADDGTLRAFAASPAPK